jgi:Flp pilus assembly protein TadG
MKMKHMANVSSLFCADRSGLAGIEFALLVPILSLFLIVAVDFGLAFKVKLELLSAIAAGAQYAQTNGSSLSSSNFTAFTAALTTVVQEVAGSSTNITVTTMINNSADGSNAGSYYCVSGSPVTWTKAASSTTTCGTNLTAGRYVTITLAGSSETIFQNNPLVDATFNLSESIIVRID